MNIKKLILLSTLLILMFSACDDKNNIFKDLLSPSEDILPTFNLKTTNNEDITIEVTKDGWKFKQYENKVILLNFFATWCPPCKAEVPHLNHLQEEYGKNFQVITILLEKDKPNTYIQKFINKYKVTYPITNSDENYLLSDAVGGVKSIPTMFLFTKDGLVYQRYKGLVPPEILISDIKKAIELPDNILKNHNQAADHNHTNDDNHTKKTVQ